MLPHEVNSGPNTDKALTSLLGSRLQVIRIKA